MDNDFERLHPLRHAYHVLGIDTLAETVCTSKTGIAALVESKINRFAEVAPFLQADEPEFTRLAAIMEEAERGRREQRAARERERRERELEACAQSAQSGRSIAQAWRAKRPDGDSLIDNRVTFAGIGTRKAKLRLSKLAAFAKALTLA
jgi:hypothetical protein